MTADESGESVRVPVDGLDPSVPGLGDDGVPEPEPDVPLDPASDDIGVLTPDPDTLARFESARAARPTEPAPTAAAPPSAPTLCYLCEKPIDPGDSSCRSCGADLAGAVVDVGAVRPDAETGGNDADPNARLVLVNAISDGDLDRHEDDGGVIEEEAPLPCYLCEKPAPADAERCPHCGIELHGPGIDLGSLRIEQASSIRQRRKREEERRRTEWVRPVDPPSERVPTLAVPSDVTTTPSGERTRQVDAAIWRNIEPPSSPEDWRSSPWVGVVALAIPIAVLGGVCAFVVLGDPGDLAPPAARPTGPGGGTSTARADGLQTARGWLRLHDGPLTIGARSEARCRWAAGVARRVRGIRALLERGRRIELQLVAGVEILDPPGDPVDDDAPLLEQAVATITLVVTAGDGAAPVFEGRARGRTPFAFVATRSESDPARSASETEALERLLADALLAIAEASSDDARAVIPSFLGFLSDADAGRRVDAARALASIAAGTPEAVDVRIILARRAVEDPIATARRAAAAALAGLCDDPEEALAPFEPLLEQRGVTARLRALEAIASFESHRGAATRSVLAVLGSCDDAVVGAEAARALVRLAPQRGEATATLEAILAGDRPELRVAAAEALGALDADGAVESLVAALGDDDPRVVEAATGALERAGSAAVPALVQAIERSAAEELARSDARAAASALAVARLGEAGEDALPALVAALDQARARGASRLVEAIIEAFVRLGPTAVDVLDVALAPTESEERLRGALDAAGRRAAERDASELWRVVKPLALALRRRGLARPPDGGDPGVDGTAAPSVDELVASIASPNAPPAERARAIAAAARVAPSERPELVARLSALLDGSADVEVRRAAADALGRSGSDAGIAVPHIVAALRSDPDGARSYLTAFARLGRSAAVATVAAARFLGSRDPLERRAAIVAVSRVAPDDADIGALVIEATADRDGRVRAAATRFVAEAGHTLAPALARALGSDVPEVRRFALARFEALPEASRIAALDDLLHVLRRPETFKEAAAIAIGSLGTAAAELAPQILGPLLVETAPGPAADACGVALLRLGEAGAGAIIPIVRDGEPAARRALARAAGRLPTGDESGSDQTAPGLRVLLDCPDPVVRLAGARALVVSHRSGPVVARAVADVLVRNGPRNALLAAVGILGATGRDGHRALDELVPILGDSRDDVADAAAAAIIAVDGGTGAAGPAIADLLVAEDTPPDAVARSVVNPSVIVRAAGVIVEIGRPTEATAALETVGGATDDPFVHRAIDRALGRRTRRATD